MGISYLSLPQEIAASLMALAMTNTPKVDNSDQNSIYDRTVGVEW